jgi:uncharacterized membrane protein YcfT
MPRMPVILGGLVANSSRPRDVSATRISEGTDRRLRVDWVDYAKGICIILVVMLYVTVGYGEDVNRESWLHPFVHFAQPFRMPDFFLISGLFLSRTIDAPWRQYLDRKVLHFVYFYVLWLAIQLAIIEAELLFTLPISWIATFAYALIEPINTLWFVHMLAIFYVVTRLVRRVPVALVLIAAAALHTLYFSRIITTDAVVFKEFCRRYVYFFTGYVAAPWIFDFARTVTREPRRAMLGLAAWAIANGVLVANGLHFWPVVSLVLGFAGAAAIVTIGSLLAQREWAWPLRYAGMNSLVVYLTFFFPRGVLSHLAIATIPDWDVAVVSLIITTCAVITPLLFHRMIRNTALNFLYVRPSAFRLVPAQTGHTNKTLSDEPQPSLRQAR